MELRNTYDKEFINRLLEEAVQLGKNKLVVIQFHGQVSVRFPGRMTKTDSEFSLIELESLTSNGDGGELFDEKLPILVQGSYRNFMFKKERVSKNDKILRFHTPYEMKIKEQRAVRRFNYKYQDHKGIALKMLKENMESQTLDGVLVDISIRGVGAVFSKNIGESFEVGQAIKILKMSDQNLKEEHHGLVVYKEVYKSFNRKNQDIKIGIQFEHSLDSVNYRSIQAIIDKKQTKCQGLNVSTFCGLTEEEQERKIAVICMENQIMGREIRENIEYLDRLRYLTKSMKQKFLLDVNIPIFATALRLSTRELIYDLLIEVSDNLRDEILFQLKDNKAASMVRDAQEKICQHMRDKEKKGELVLDPLSFETYV
jgi:hypothetical protein